MNPWMQILTPQNLPTPPKKERIYNGVRAGHKPCARCEVAPRERKSYCRECHNIMTRAAMKKRYYAVKEAKQKAGVAAVFLDEGEYSVHRKAGFFDEADNHNSRGG